jgi:SAM-dependent methyltransferase
MGKGITPSIILGVPPEATDHARRCDMLCRDLMSTSDAFSGKARQYAEHRFDYPDDFLAQAFGRVALGPGTRVAELGSGTGLLSRHLLRYGAHVYGVEPSSDMRAEAERVLHGAPRFVSVAGSAESTQLPDAAVDLIVAGNAFHYFDPVRARAEADRILVRGGGVLLLDHQVPASLPPFMEAYMDFVRRWTPPALSQAHAKDDLPRRIATFFVGRSYTTEGLCELSYPMTFERLRARFLSTSIAPRPDAPSYGPVLADLEGVFWEHAQEGVVPFLLLWTATWSSPGAVGQGAHSRPTERRDRGDP